MMLFSYHHTIPLEPKMFLWLLGSIRKTPIVLQSSFKRLNMAIQSICLAVTFKRWMKILLNTVKMPWDIL